jgi:lathosterol oxidase
MTESNRSSGWNYQPSEPIKYNPLFDFPPKLALIFGWMIKRWVSISRFVLFLTLAFFLTKYLMPSLSIMGEFDYGWVTYLFMRNTALLFLIAGTLHLYLHILKVQGDDFKFLKKEMAKNNKKFKFRNQVYDNIFWSVFSGVTIWTFYEAIYWYGIANGIVKTSSFQSSPVQFFLWIICLPLIRGVHFYSIHRLLHVPFLYKHVHVTHHRNVNTGPWSGISMHPVENIIYQSSPLIHIFIPTDPMIFTLHLILVTLNPAFTHSGFEQIKNKKTKLLDSADFHHQLHHRYFDCNYGNMDVPLDVWFGTHHDGSEEATKAMRLRMKGAATK